MLYQHKETTAKFITDGGRLNTTVKLSPDNKDILLTSVRAQDNSKVQIKVKYVAEIQPSDSAYLQFYNIVLRIMMERLKISRT